MNGLRGEPEALPKGYSLLSRVRLPMLEILGLAALSFPLYLWLFGLVGALLTSERFAFSFSVTARSLVDGLRVLIAVIVMGPLTITLHEWSHGLAFRAFGHRPRYGFRWTYAYATADGAALTRGQFIVVALAPLILLTLLGLVLLLVLPARGYVVLFLATNAAGAMGDLWLVRQVLRFPPHIRVVDREDCVEIYGQPPDRRLVSPASGLVVRWLGIAALTFFLLYTVTLLVVPLVLDTLGVSHLTLGPEGVWRILEYSRTEEELSLSLGLIPLLIVSGFAGVVLIFIKPTQRESLNGVHRVGSEDRGKIGETMETRK